MTVSKAFVIHNPLLCGVVLWRFARSHYEVTPQAEPAILPKVMLVLPIVLHAQSAAVVGRMRKASGLARAIADAPEIRMGFQERLEGFAEETFRGINMAHAAGLVKLATHDGWPSLVPAVRPQSLPKALGPFSEDCRQMVHAADRLGVWFATASLQVLCTLLSARF